MYHLPMHHHFQHHMGFLGGAQSYTSKDRWFEDHPYQNNTYSSDLYGEHALNIVKNHDYNNPLFLYLPF